MPSQQASKEVFVSDWFIKTHRTFPKHQRVQTQASPNQT
jgi:hypothetical protein